MPRVTQIARRQGTIYATIYMLNLRWIEALERLGVPERKAMDFVGTNAGTLREYGSDADAIAERIKRLRSQTGPDGKTSLFEWACRDSAIFWDIEHARHVSSENVETAWKDAALVMGRYADTDLPMILTKYGTDNRCFTAALKALVRFDNFDSKNPNIKSTAARFLSHFQNNDIFKHQLGQYGARLIPAISVGGEDVIRGLHSQSQ